MGPESKHTPVQKDLDNDHPPPTQDLTLTATKKRRPSAGMHCMAACNYRAFNYTAFNPSSAQALHLLRLQQQCNHGVTCVVATPAVAVCVCEWNQSSAHVILLNYVCEWLENGGKSRNHTNAVLREREKDRII